MLKRYWGAVFVLLLVCGCRHHDETSTPSETGQPAATVRERLEGLETEMGSVALERAFSDRYFRSGGVTGAWVDGSDLFVQVFDSARRIYVMHAVDLNSGRPLWVCDLGAEPVRFPPSGGDQYVVFLLEGDAGMMVVNRRTGGYDFRVRTRLHTLPSGSAVASDTSVFLTSLVGERLVAINPATGAKGWNVGIDGTPINSPVITPRIPRHLVVLASDSGAVKGVPAVAWNGGAPESSAIWSYQAQGAISAPLTIASRLSKTGVEVSALVPCEDRGLHCLDAQSGEVRWIARTAHPFTQVAREGGGRVFARNAHRMMVWNLADGDAAWPMSPDDQALYPYEEAERVLAADDKRAYLDMGRGRVSRFDGRSGEFGAEGVLGSFDWVLPATDANVLLGVTKDGYLVAFK